jgi:putative Holliday junction resolvase
MRFDELSEAAADAGGEPRATAAPDLPRLLAVDLGSKRVGLAVSQGSLALPLRTLARGSDRETIEAIAAAAREEGATALVVGEPLRLDGSRGDAADRARAFAARLERHAGLPCTLVDERLTSRAAEDRLRAAGVDPRRHPERVDQVAAQILLEEALDRLAAAAGGRR